MKKLLIKFGIEALVALLSRSVKGEHKFAVMLLVTLIGKLAEVMTDDNDDNTAQVKQVLAQHWAEIKQAVDGFL